MEIFKELLVLMVVVWTVAVVLRRLGCPTVMGELVMGVVLGPVILGWVNPNEIIHVLAEMGIFFLMLHNWSGNSSEGVFYGCSEFSWGCCGGGQYAFFDRFHGDVSIL